MEGSRDCSKRQNNLELYYEEKQKPQPGIEQLRREGLNGANLHEDREGVGDDDDRERE